MKKRTVLLLLAAALLVGVAAAAGGDAGDPLISLDYLTNIFRPAAEKAALEKLDAAEKAVYAAAETQWRAVVAAGEAAAGSSRAAHWTEARLKKGDVLSGLTGAQVMLLVGTNGSGLEHPDWERHLALAVYLQNAVNAAHPTLMRPIALVNERYNQHLSPGSILIEVGSSGNTLQEALRAVWLFGESAGSALAALKEG